MVRYHSLVIDPKSLPKELIPIAWTSTAETLPFQGVKRSNSFLNASKENKDIFNGMSELSDDSKDVKGGKVLMGIMHSSRPHYGLQVSLVIHFEWEFGPVSLICNINFVSATSSTQKVLQHVTEDSFSRISGKSQRIIGSCWRQPPSMKEGLIMLVTAL